MFWLGLSLGCLALLMVQYLSGGFGALSIRRVLEAASKCLPLMFVSVPAHRWSCALIFMRG